MIHSFDIFDTCLCRICGEPYQVFDIIAKNIYGNSVTDTQIADFRYARIKAELMARNQRYIDNEVTIEEIYKQVDFSKFTPCSNEEVLKQELLVEQQMLCPIEETLREIRGIHKEGRNVVYISDMYLPYSFLKDVLVYYSFWEEGDKLYLSCDYRKSKRKGDLYRYIRKELHIKSFWLHKGDNIISDVLTPLRNGVFSKKVNTSYSHYERKLIEKEIHLADSPLACVAGISKSIVLSHSYDPYIKFASDLIAPLYTCFVYEVLRKSRERGLKKLYFLARDGYILYRIALNLNFLFPEIEVRYLYVSRKALYLPSIEIFTKDALLDIIPTDFSKTASEFLDYFQINPSEFNLDNNVVFTIGELLDTPELYQLIKTKWHEQRELLITYFRQEGLASTSNDVAIIDIRGTRKCQLCINRILRSYSYCDTFAFYLDADMRRIIPIVPNEYDSFLFGGFQENMHLKGFYKNEILFEKYFALNTFSRTAGYAKNDKGDVIPIFDNGELVKPIYKKIQKINEDVCSLFVEGFLKCKLEKDTKYILQASLATVADFSKELDRDYLVVLRDVCFSETQLQSVPVISKITPFNFYKKNYAWREASIKYTSPALLWIYNRLLNIYSLKKYFKCLCRK